MPEIDSHSVLLRSKIAVGLPLLFAAGDSIYRGKELRERYSQHLIALHGTVRATVPLMETALEVIERKHQRDPIAIGVAEYLKRHIPEEIGHDDWLLQDLEVLGVARQEVLSRPPTPSVAALVGAQYYWIFHHHPLALLGYIAVMEGNPPSVDSIEHFIERSALPKSAFYSLQKHASFDPHHRDELNKTLDELPLTREHDALLGISALHTVSAVSDALSEVASRFR